MKSFATVELADQWALLIGAEMCTVMVYRSIPIVSYPYQKQGRSYGNDVWRDCAGLFCYPQWTSKQFAERAAR